MEIDPSKWIGPRFSRIELLLRIMISVYEIQWLIELGDYVFQIQIRQITTGDDQVNITKTLSKVIAVNAGIDLIADR
jgi:hypothetical protein